MEKRKLGWLINGCLLGATVITGIIFPNPAVIFPVVAGAALTGTVQSIFTIAESKGEREDRERRTQVKQVATSESGPKPQKVYENLHENENQATFKGNHTQLLDNRRSTITKPEIKQYKSEITKENISAVTSSSTFDLAGTGSDQMRADGYTMVNDETTLER